MTTNSDIEKLGSNTVGALISAQGMHVGSPADYIEAGRRREALKEIERQIDATFDPLIEQAYKHHKALVAEKRRHSEPIEQARGIYKRLMFAWEDRIEQERKAEEARLQAEAKRQAEEDALVAAENAATEAEAMAAIECVQVAPVIVTKSLPKVAGHSRRPVPKFRIVDASKLPRQYLSPDEKKIGGVVRSLKAAHGIPGVEYYEEIV